MIGNNGRVEVIDITPAMAEAWLGKNIGNRNIRKSVVERYASDMIAGNWRDTDAMYTVREDGALLDGQHRLRAICLANREVRGIVHIVQDDVTAMDLRLDTGIGRTASDILGIGTHLSAAARSLFVVATRGGQMASSADVIGPIVKRVEPEFSRLTTSTRRGFSTAAVVSAVCFSMWRYPAESAEIAAQYHALVLDDRETFVWPALHSAAKQLIVASYQGRRRSIPDSFLRIAKAVEPDYRHVARVQFKDQEIYRARIQPIVCQYIGLPSTEPPIERA